jgi:aspartate racemase
MFDRYLLHRNRDHPRPDDQLLDTAILPSIAHVKATQLAMARPLMEEAVKSLLSVGASLVILACTEAPIALATSDDALKGVCIDTTLALAEATVALWREIA